MNQKTKKIKIAFSLDERVFCLFCALILCNVHQKFKEKLPKSSFYKNVQNYLQSLNISNIKMMEQFFDRGHYVQYLCWTLRQSDFPEFKLKTKNKDSLQKPNIWFQGFNQVLRKFYKEAEIKKLWQKSKPNYQKVISFYKRKTNSQILQIIKHLEKENIEWHFNEIILIPNLLETTGAGSAPLITPRAYIVFGPSFEKVDTYLIIHEFLHHLINPILEEKKIKKKSEIFKKLYPLLTNSISRKFYPKWQWIISEYFVRGLQASFIQNKTKQEKFFAEEKKQGFSKIKWFTYCFFKLKNKYSLKEKIIEILNELQNISDK
ncbi:DUF4932 domain-containing protein [Candidatus Parcubacteria bacterium]|nr:DUF4932 domain-containing protein [Candidatus Parcubacteria bacterium]